MTINKIFKLMKLATKSEAECYSRAFAAMTNTESATHSLEADKWGKEWVRLSRKAGKLADRGQDTK